MSVRILSNNGGIAATNCFLIADEQTKQAVVFDAPDHTVGPVLEEAKRQGWDVIGLWFTHGHFDHIADHLEVSRQFPDAKVLIHRLDEPKLLNPSSMSIWLPFKIAPRQPDGYVEDGQRLTIGSIDVRVIHTPGHAPGHVCYYLESESLLVGGDLIICGAVGRTDLPDSDPAALDASIRQIMTLPDGTLLLPGHCDPGTLGDERKANPYVRQALAGG